MYTERTRCGEPCGTRPRLLPGVRAHVHRGPLSLPAMRAAARLLEGTHDFSSFRGAQDAVTPLKISFVACIANAILNPILMFSAGMGMAGAALATSFSQLVAGGAYLALLLKRGLLSWATMLRAPSKEMLGKLAAAAGAVQV